MELTISVTVRDRAVYKNLGPSVCTREKAILLALPVGRDEFLEIAESTTLNTLPTMIASLVDGVLEDKEEQLQAWITGERERQAELKQKWGDSDIEQMEIPFSKESSET